MDIKLLLLRIKDNIKLIEADDYDDRRLDEVRSDFLDMMELIKLFMISERDAYYGYFMMNMQFSVNFQSDSIAGIKLNTFPPVFESNPLLLCKFSLKEIIYVCCHEIDHVVLNHPAEMVKANPEQDPKRFYEFNLAADAAVNDRLDNEIEEENHNFMSRPDGVITSEYLGKAYNIINIRFMENYAYYFDLIGGKKTKSNMPENGGQAMMDKKNSEEDGDSSGGENGKSDKNKKKEKNPDEKGNGDSDDDDGDESNDENGGSSGKRKVITQKDLNDEDGQTGDLEAPDKKDQGNGDSGDADGDAQESDNDGEDADSEGNGESKVSGNGSSKPSVVTSKNAKSISDHNWEAGNDAEDAAAAVKEFVNVSVDSMNKESRGYMPGWFMSQVEKINEPPKLSWQKILKKYIGTISANKTKTRMRLNRRQPERFDLSGTKEDKILKIVVAIDTSGSVSDKEIAYIFNEIFAILAKRKHEITVIECDARINRVYKAKNAGEIQTKVLGRGGTAFTPVIEYVNNNKYFRDALLIYFTDGGGEGQIPKPLTYRNIWVLTTDWPLSVKEPYGIVLNL